MTCAARVAVAVGLLACTSSAATAQNVQAALQLAAGCAPRATATPVPMDALRVVGAQDFTGRQLFGARDLVVIAGGRRRGLDLGQQFFVRRPSPGRESRGARAVTTAGWIRIVAVDDTTAIALVDYACDGLLVGDHLEPYVAPVIPSSADRTDTEGDPDFSSPGRLLFGDNERMTGATGDFMVIDIGETRGAAPGLRVALYRNGNVPGLPLAAVGEGIVVFTDAETSVVRLTRTRDAIVSGDLVIPRRR